MYLTRSADDGASWSAPVNISGSVDGHREAGQGFIGTGHAGGIELARTGRLLVPMHGPCTMIYSDDGGASWAKAPGGMSNGGECQVAEIRPGLIIATGRNDEEGFTEIAYSTDDGMTFSPSVPNRDLPSPIDGVEASIVFHPGTQRLYHSAPDSFSFRTDLHVKSSADDGKTWMDLSAPWEGGSAGYSALAVLGDEADAPLGLLYDRNNHTMLIFEARGVTFTTVPVA